MWIIRHRITKSVVAYYKTKRSAERVCRDMNQNHHPGGMYEVIYNILAICD